MSKKRALLMVRIDPPMEDEAEWHDWYDTEYVPARLNAMQGFLSARRFIRIEGTPKLFGIESEAKYLVLFELASTGVLRSKAYIELIEKEATSDRFMMTAQKLPKCTCGVYEQIYPIEGDYQPPTTELILLLGHDVPKNRHQEFSAWYNTEHIPAMLRVPGFISARRFRLDKKGLLPVYLSQSVPQYITVYDVECETVFDSEIYRKESMSPWSTWIRSSITRRICAVYRQIYR